MTDPNEPSGKRSFFAELKRRNVLRAAALYVAAVWALSQGIAQLAPAFNAPDWITRWFVIACVIGFPFWLGFSWFFELTPAGIHRDTADSGPSDSVRRHIGRKMDFLIIGILAIAVVLLVTNQFVVRGDATSMAGVEKFKAAVAALAQVPFKSVAVLPLTNDSGDPKQQYFSDGLSEELISDLTQVTGLKVIGQFSSFKFRDSKESPAEIGAALGVAHLILGSVRQSADTIRVTVNMIRSRDGASVWSHSYDAQLKDVFAIQSEIGKAVAAALKIELLGHSIVSSDKPPSGNVEAYRLMLQGHTLARRYTAAGFQQGIALLEQAVKLDPAYAYSWGALSTGLINQGQMFLTGEARQRAYAQARVAARKQLALAPNAASTHMNQGYLLANVNKDPVGALAEYRRGLELRPHDGTAMTFLAYGLANVGQLKPAIELFRKAIASDPLHANWYFSLGSLEAADGQLDDAERVTRKALALQPDLPGIYVSLTQIDILRGDADGARRYAAKEADPVYGPWARTLAQQIGPDRRQADAALRDYIAKQGKDQPYFVADLYALRKQPDQMFEWLNRAWNQHDPAFSSMLYDPFALAYKNDPRFAALCNQAGLPVPGQPLPDAANANGY